MLQIRVKSYEDLPTIQRDDIDFLFDYMVALRPDDITKTLLAEIEEATYSDANSFIDRFGYKLHSSCLSTTCKAALLVAYNPDTEYDLTCCGLNGRDSIVRNIKNGKILILNDNITFSYDDENYPSIDVQMYGYRFTDIDRLNTYMQDEWPRPADLDTPGIEKL